MNQINVQRPSGEREQLSIEEQSALWTLLDTLTDPEIPVVTPREMRILRALRGRPGHIFNLGHGVPPAAKLENIESLVGTVRSWGGAC